MLDDLVKRARRQKQTNGAQHPRLVERVFDLVRQLGHDVRSQGKACAQAAGRPFPRRGTPPLEQFWLALEGS